MENSSQPVNNLLETLMHHLQELTDVNIIIGNRIEYNNICVIPVSKVKCGFISGGVDQKKERRGDLVNPFGGGAGGSLNIIPVAFLAFVDNDVKILHLDDSTHTLEKIIDFIPSTISTIIKSVKKEKKEYTIEK